MKKYINFKFVTRAKFHKTKSTHDGQTGSVNSTCQLKLPFDRFSSCHTNPFEYHSQQNDQLATVMSNNNRFILLELKFEQDSQSNNSQEHERFSHSGSANNWLCVLFAERRSQRLISCPDQGLEKKNVYNLDGESRRSRLGSCFYNSLDLAFYNSHRIAMIQVICLVASLESERPQVRSSRQPHEKTVLRLQRSRFRERAQAYWRSLFRSPIRSKIKLGLTWFFGIFVILFKHLAFQYIFAILNTLQGVFIFCFHIVRSDDVRKLWVATFKSFSRSTGTSHVEEITLESKNRRVSSTTTSPRLSLDSSTLNLAPASGGTNSLVRQSMNMPNVDA